MLIYRVEDSLGHGYKGDRATNDYPSLYALVNTIGLFCDKTAFLNPHTQPLPWQDNIPKCFLKRSGWKFAFKHIHDMVRWFSPYDLYIMGLCGGELVAYEINEKHIWWGGNQCVFYDEYSICVSRETLHHYTFIKSIEQCIDDIDDINESIESINGHLEKIKMID